MEIQNSVYSTIDVTWGTETQGTSWGLTGLQVSVVADDEVALNTPN
jgi:hypothetical protein